VTRTESTIASVAGPRAVLGEAPIRVKQLLVRAGCMKLPS